MSYGMETRVQLGIGAANHDPSEFLNPEQLDFTRGKVNSLAFGYGPHFCLGAALARMESRVIEIIRANTPRGISNTDRSISCER